jgi:hypothetical protein
VDGAEWIRNQLTGYTCGACGRRYRRGRIRVLARREELFFVDLACGECGSEAVAIVSVERDDLDAPRVEAGELDEAQAVDASDILAMHHFLEGFNGDFRRLFGPDGEPRPEAGGA